MFCGGSPKTGGGAAEQAANANNPHASAALVVIDGMNGNLPND
jgi:hypothetical protein